MEVTQSFQPPEGGTCEENGSGHTMGPHVKKGGGGKNSEGPPGGLGLSRSRFEGGYFGHLRMRKSSLPQLAGYFSQRIKEMESMESAIQKRFFGV